MTESIARPLTHVELILGLDRFERGYLAQLPATRRLAQEISGHTQHIVETLSLLSHTPQQTARFLVPAMPMASLSTESLLSMRAFYELGDALERLE